MPANNTRTMLLAALALPLLFCWSCSSDDETTNPIVPDPTQDLTANCIGCHTDQELLQATALPDEDPAGDPSGEG